MKKIIIGILFSLCSLVFAEQVRVYTDIKFQELGLSKQDITTIQSYAKQNKTFDKYRNDKELRYMLAPDKVKEAIQVDSINQAVVQYNLSPVFMSTICTSMMINKAIKQFGDDELFENTSSQVIPLCYLFAFNSGRVTTGYYEQVNINGIIDSAYICNSKDCFNTDDKRKIKPAMIGDVYARMVQAMKQCKTKVCRVNIALIAYNGVDMYENSINKLPYYNSPQFTKDREKQIESMYNQMLLNYKINTSK